MNSRRNLAMTVALMLLALALVGCAKRPEKSTTTPAVEPRGETGLASWYGERFHGRSTASGEIYDMHELSAAHRSLPFGTRVRVTLLETGRSVTVRINDRGPFVEGRIIDLSYAAARQLKMIEAGVAQVRIEIRDDGGRS